MSSAHQHVQCEGNDSWTIFMSMPYNKCRYRKWYLQTTLRISVTPDPVLLLAFAALDTLLDFWIEALTSSNKSPSRLSNVKQSLSIVEIESADLWTSSWIPGNVCFSPFSTPSIMLDSSSGSRTPEHTQKIYLSDSHHVKSKVPNLKYCIQKHTCTCEESAIPC